MECPQAKTLQQLLEEKLPADEQQAIQGHLDTCELCQKTIERLAAGGVTWDKTANNLSERPDQEPTALADAVEKLQNVSTDPLQTQAESAAAHLDDDIAFLQPSQKPGSIGRLDKYEILAVVGKGGFGVVLKAFDEDLHRVVAIKVMSPHLASNGAARQRFIREARAAAAVTHENVVTIHEVKGEVKIPYLAMQFVSGQTLNEKIDKAGPLSVKEILRIGSQIAEGLAAAHKQGLIHRDIKPANILLENGIERVKISDFGLARSVDDASVTQSGTVAGTPMYMSPEQANGEQIDHRSDLFSLGSVLYVMATGRPPFRATTTMAVMKRVCEDTPTPVQQVNTDIPDWLGDIFARLHAKKPADRIQTARDVADVLGKHLADVQGGRILVGTSHSTVTLPAAGAAIPGSGAPTSPLAPQVAPKPAAKSSGRGCLVVALIVFLVGALPAGLLALCLVVALYWAVDLRPGGHGEGRGPGDGDGMPPDLVENRLKPKKVQGPDEVPVAPIADGGWVQLFNGKDLAGWDTGTGKNWTVEDGHLVGRFDRDNWRAFLNNGRRYDNFHLRFEVNLNAEAQSDIYVRADDKRTGGYGLKLSPKLNIASLIAVNAKVAGKPTKGEPYTVRADQWILGEIIARGSTIQMKLDGKEVSQARVETVRPGGITLAIQAGTVVRYKKIEIKELPPAATFVVENGILDYAEVHDIDEPAFTKWLEQMKKDDFRPVTLSIQSTKDGQRYTSVAIKEAKKRLWEFTRDDHTVGDMWAKGYVAIAQCLFFDSNGKHHTPVLWVWDPKGSNLGIWHGYKGIVLEKIEDGRKTKVRPVYRSAFQQGGYVYGVVLGAPTDEIWSESDHQSLQECRAWIEKQKAIGWRPVHLYAYGEGAKTLFGTILIQDASGPDWDVSWALTPAEYAAALSTRKAQGFRPHTAVGHDDNDGNRRFSVIWIRFEEPGVSHRESGWMQLFNGKDLTGLKQLPVIGGLWSVDKDGILTGKHDPKGATIAMLPSARSDYVNFHVRAELKMQGKSGTAGLTFRDDPANHQGNLAGVQGSSPSQRQPVLSIHQKSGLSSNVKPRTDMLRDWFTVEIVAQGPKVTYRLDGQTQWEVSDALEQPGPLALKVGTPDCTLLVRKFEVKELPAPEPGWVQLFNGTNLAGWNLGEEPSGVWKVEDGHLVGKGHQGWLMTDRTNFRDFHLRMDAKYVNGTAQLVLRGKGERSSEGYWLNMNNDKGNMHTGALSTSVDFKAHTSIVREERTKPNEWFTLEVIARGKHFQTFVNGEKALDWTDPAPQNVTEGNLRFYLLRKDVELHVKKIEIKELPPAAP